MFILSSALFERELTDNILYGTYTDDTLYMKRYTTETEIKIWIQENKSTLKTATLISKPNVFTTLDNLFKDCHVLEEVFAEKLHTENVTSAISTFENCQSLNKVYISNWNMEKITTIENMFKNCINLIQD